MAQTGIYEFPDGTFKDAWGNIVENPDVEGTEEVVPEGKVDYSAMTAQELKDEVARRQAEGREFDLSGVKVKADLVSLLEADDAKQEG